MAGASGFGFTKTAESILFHQNGKTLARRLLPFNAAPARLPIQHVLFLRDQSSTLFHSSIFGGVSRGQTNGVRR